MKHIIIIFVLTLNFNCFSQTQAEMNKEAYTEYNKSDQELNEIYKTILSIYKTDTLFIKNLKKSQRMWIQFRESINVNEIPRISR